MLAEIRGFYEELNKFWKEEIRHVDEALKKHRTDLRDFERWDDFYSSLILTIEYWKVCFFIISTIHLVTNQNILFRIGYQVVMLEPHAATIQPHL